MELVVSIQEVFGKRFYAFQVSEITRKAFNSLFVSNFLPLLIDKIRQILLISPNAKHVATSIKECIDGFNTKS